MGRSSAPSTIVGSEFPFGESDGIFVREGQERQGFAFLPSPFVVGVGLATVLLVVLPEAESHPCPGTEEIGGEVFEVDVHFRDYATGPKWAWAVR